MKLGDRQIENMKKRHAAGEDIAALAKAYRVTPATIKRHLAPAAEAQGPVFTHDEEHPSDEALGIGEEEAAATDSLAELMANPALQKLIDAAVNARLAQFGAPNAAIGQTDQMAAFTASLAHLIEVQSMQQPGYIKPLPAAEIDRRAAGLVEMKALLGQFEKSGTAPLYLVGEQGFFECTNAQEFSEGMKIRTYLPPTEDMVPQNRQAEEVHAAMIQWIGGPTPGIGEQVEAAIIASKQAPMIDGKLAPIGQRRGPVELVEAPQAEPKKRRMTGTIVPERHNVSQADRLASGPQGPVFVADRAA